jgi:dipeptidyl aminopeptidase/acylaminoacyl peptidase
MDWRRHTSVVARRFDGRVVSMRLMPDGRSLAVTINDAGTVRGLAIGADGRDASDGEAVAARMAAMSVSHGQDETRAWLTSPDGAWMASSGATAQRAPYIARAAADTLYFWHIVSRSRGDTSTSVVVLPGTAGTGDSAYTLPVRSEQSLVWTRDGTRVLLTDHGYLWVADPARGTARRLATPVGRLAMYILRESAGRVLTQTLDPFTGRVGLWWVDLKTARWRCATEVDMAVSGAAVTGQQGNSTIVAFVGSTLRSPRNVYMYSLNGPAADVQRRQLTHATVPVPLPAVADTVFTYRIGSDARGTAVLIKPAAAAPATPTIVYAYPDASAVIAQRFTLAMGNGLVEPFQAVARGYAVLFVDAPTLSAAGEYGVHGPAAAIAQSMTAALNEAARLQLVDTTRLGVIGHSYGGYMVDVLVTRTSRFRAAVSVSGFSDLVSGWAGATIFGSEFFMTGQARMERRVRDAPGRYVENSPALAADDVSTPLLLIHGAQDALVHSSQSEEMFRALAQQHKRVELVRYRQAEHTGDETGPNGLLVASWERALDWFDAFLPVQRTSR